jgi:Uma2 family endonuclease
MMASEEHPNEDSCQTTKRLSRLLLVLHKPRRMEQYVKIPDRPSCCPDVVLTCDEADWDKKKRLKPFKIQFPRVVVEVLSPSTEKYDRKGKFARYRRCASLEVYLLVNQDERLIEVFRRKNGWRREVFSGEQVITLVTGSEEVCCENLEEIGNSSLLTLSLEEVYRGVVPVAD